MPPRRSSWRPAGAAAAGGAERIFSWLLILPPPFGTDSSRRARTACRTMVVWGVRWSWSVVCACWAVGVHCAASNPCALHRSINLQHQLQPAGGLIRSTPPVRLDSIIKPGEGLRIDRPTESIEQSPKSIHRHVGQSARPAAMLAGSHHRTGLNTPPTQKYPPRHVQEVVEKSRKPLPQIDVSSTTRPTSRAAAAS